MVGDCTLPGQHPFVDFSLSSVAVAGLSTVLVFGNVKKSTKDGLELGD